jgi:hypothetical protein
MAQIINPENKYWYGKTDRNWSVARDATDSDSITAGNGTNERVVLLDDGGANYLFARTYLIFDITTVITPVNNAKLYVSASTSVNKNPPTIYATYGGNNPKGITSDYSLYLDNLSKTGDPLSTIPILSRGEWYSGLLDINVYPIDPLDGLYVIGLVTEPDFANAVGSTESGVIGISAYLSINETAGYPNTVMGVPGANISTVSGVPSANIANIMGV